MTSWSSTPSRQTTRAFLRQASQQETTANPLFRPLSRKDRRAMARHLAKQVWRAREVDTHAPISDMLEGEVVETL